MIPITKNIPNILGVQNNGGKSLDTRAMNNTINHSFGKDILNQDWRNKAIGSRGSSVVDVENLTQKLLMASNNSNKATTID